MAIDKVFYVEEWNTKYTVYRVKADSEAGVKDIYWDETDERVEGLHDGYTEGGETCIYKEEDREKLCIWKPYWEVSNE